MKWKSIIMDVWERERGKKKKKDLGFVLHFGKK